jgi:hypothetical protein
MTADELLVKTPFEERLFNFEFVKDMDTGETVTGTPVITITPSGALTATGIVASGTTVQARFIGGTAGVTYHVACQAVTSTQKRELCGELEVVVC